MMEQQNSLEDIASSVGQDQGDKNQQLLFEESGSQQGIEQEQSEVVPNLTLDPVSIKQLVIKHQNNDKGYYCYENWIQLHQQIFNKSEEVFTHMWRTLKLINFGDDYIPTGLIYDTLVTLFNIDRSTLDNEPILKQLFFKFIELNGKVIFDHQKTEINYLKILKRLIEEYRYIILRRLSEKEYSVQSQEKPRYERLHHLHDLYVYRKNLEKLKRIDEEMKMCTFQPELSASRQTIQSRYWRDPIPRVSELAPDQELFESTIFRAKPLPSYPNRYPSGFESHTNRIKQTFEEKSLKKSMRPLVKTGSVSQFSINNRNSQRKVNSFTNRKVLFMIEIEVGKKKYMLKVREGMSPEEVSHIIQRMAGFSDADIYEIVEEYFSNYFKRINKDIEI